MDPRARHLLRRALSAGRTREALRLAEHAIAEDASDGQAVAFAAMAEAELGQWDAAADRLAAAAGPTSGGLWLRDAALLVIRRAPAGEARLALSRRLSAGVGDVSGRLLLAHAECLIAAGRFEDASACVGPSASAAMRSAFASRLAVAGERLRAAGDGRASAALDASLRALPQGAAWAGSLQVGQLAASLGRIGDVVGLLRVAGDGTDEPPAREAMLGRIFNAACDLRELSAAQEAFGLMRTPPEAMRMRLAVALTEVGDLDAAASLAASLAAPSLRGEMADRLLLAAGDRPLLPLLGGLLNGAGLPFSAIMRLLASTAFRRDLAAVAPLLEAMPLADAIKQALLRAALAWAEGDLPAARAGLRRVLAEAPEDRRALSVAFEIATSAGDLDDMGDVAARLAPALADEELPTLWWRLCCAMMESGREEQAQDLLGRIRGLLAGFRNQGRASLPGFAGTYFHLAICFFDLDAARTLASAFAADRGIAEAWAKTQAAVANDPELAEFVRNAGEVFIHPEVASESLASADLAVVVAPVRLASFAFEGTAPEGRAGDEPRSRQALSRVLRLARAAGLRVAIVPAPGRAVPDAILKSDVQFVSFHSFGSSPRGRHVMVGPLPDTLLIDPTGYAGWASIAQQPLASLPLGDLDATAAREWRLAEMSRLSLFNHSKHAQRARGAAPVTQGLAVLLALQVPSDTVMRHAWLDMFELTRVVVLRYRSSGAAVLVKRHPKCADPRTDALLREVGREPHVTITDASIHDLFAVVKAVYCVNSGVGAEALLHGLPVHISGLADYRHVCHEIHRAEDIRADESAFQLPVDEATFDRYVYWYRNIHHVPLDQPGALDAAIETRILQAALARRKRSTGGPAVSDSMPPGGQGSPAHPAPCPAADPGTG